MILRNFLYLNGTALGGYLSAAEDGLRTQVEHEVSKSRDASVEADVKFAKGHLGGAGGGVNRTHAEDTPEARFNRLLKLAETDSESLAWIDVVDPDTDLAEVGFGAMIAGEAEFYIPTVIRSLTSNQGGLSDQCQGLKRFRWV